MKKQKFHRIDEMKRLRKSKFRKRKDQFSKITSIRSEILIVALEKCHKLKVIIKERVVLMTHHKISLIKIKSVKVVLHYIIMMNKWKLN